MAEALEVEQGIPEFDRKRSEQDYLLRLTEKNYLILIAELDGKPVGYKVGYELSDTEFYSWLGGVLPQYRKLGIASALREFQESWAFSQGYRSIHVYSYNRFRYMLNMLISSGYKIASFAKDTNLDDCKIGFIKPLNQKL